MLFAYLLPLWFLPLILLLFYVLFDILFIVQKSNKISFNHLLISLLSKFFCPYIICVFTLYCTVVKKPHLITQDATFFASKGKIMCFSSVSLFSRCSLFLARQVEPYTRLRHSQTCYKQDCCSLES